MSDATPLCPPSIVTRDSIVSAEEMAARSAAFVDALHTTLPVGTPLVAMVLGNDAESVALFFALAALDPAMVLLGADPHGWNTEPAWPRGTCLVLPPGRAHLAGEAAARGLAVCCIPTADPSRRSATPLVQGTRGLVFLTSGSTGVPKPVCRRFETLAGAARMLAAALPLVGDGGILGAVPLDRAFGANNALMLATVTGRPLGLLERFDHNEFFALCEERAWAYWGGTPALADILSRSTRRVPPGMPKVATVVGRVSPSLAEAYQQRFGVPPRGLYGTTETFTIALALGSADEVSGENVGRPLPGVDVRIGAPDVPAPVGETGRVWIRTPWMMEGYGYPPTITSPLEHGWWATPDLGRLDDEGRLTIVSRADDRIRTATGLILDPRPLAAAIEAVDGVREAVVVPVDAADGTSFAVLVEADASVRPTAVRAALAAALPAGTQPRLLRVVEELPRLSSGRADRRACLDLLTRPRHVVTRT